MNRALAAAMVLLLLGAPMATASTWAHGIVQDETHVGVSGGTVRIDHEHQNQWYKERETENMTSAYFGWGLTKAGSYRVAYEQDGYEVVEIRSGEFTLDTVPDGDILIVVRRSTATPKPDCLSFQQFTWMERRSVLDTAGLHIGRPLENMLDWDHDPTLLRGLRDQLLGAPVTIRFETMGLTARAFCNGILTMRPVEREECMDYGVITWDGSQDWNEE